jgi:hypothetical protein
VPTRPVGVGLSTKQFAGKTCQLWITEVPTKKDPTQFRNYVDKCLPTPAPRMRPQRPSQPPQGTQGKGRVQLDGYPAEDGDLPFEPLIEE